MGQVVSIIWRLMQPSGGSSALPGYDRDLVLPLQHQPERCSIHVDVDVDVITDHQPLLASSITGSGSNDNYFVHEDEINTKEDNDEVALVDHEDKVVVVVQEKLHTLRTSRSGGNVRRIGLYKSSQSILLLGEGDFSFSACLAVAFGSASNMVATSLNNKEFLLPNYAKFSANNNELLNRGCIVLHGVDATKMATHPQLCNMKFDRIVFNFPHSGFRSKETPQSEMGRHQKLVSRFLRNAKKMLEDDGQIHITHKSNGIFLKWNITKLAYDQRLNLVEEVKFKCKKYPGYHSKYGFGGDKDFDCNPSKTYKFSPY